MHINTPQDLAAQFVAVRRATEALCSSLIIEDYSLQGADFASPPKWHLAHTSWFFETFLLEKVVPNYRPFNKDFAVLFNSYYQSVGPQFTRAERGLLSRPSVKQVYEYRAQVDQAVQALLDGGQCPADTMAVIALGCQHEMQHQELLLTDLKYSFSKNPTHPQYSRTAVPASRAVARSSRSFAEGLYAIGHEGPGFCFDNEMPRHKIYQPAFKLSENLVTNGDYLEFMESGGYENSSLWLSDGFQAVATHGWRAPLYWQQRDDQWWHFTLNGLQPIDPHAPVSHVSYYEAEAYARFVDCRLPTEAEWEIAASQGGVADDDNLLDAGLLGPIQGPERQSLFGNVWNWTASSYNAYPGFQPAPGNVGEYNGKFMANQFVLRGGSCVTPRAQVRASYRNFFYPEDRWQFSGIRLAEDAR